MIKLEQNNTGPFQVQCLDQISDLINLLCNVYGYNCFMNIDKIFLNLQQVVAAINAGIIPLGNTSAQISHWDLGSSFFFAGTVITTIGRTQLIIFL